MSRRRARRLIRQRFRHIPDLSRTPAGSVSTDGEAFFGAGGASNPEGLNQDWDGLRNVNGPHFVSPHTVLLMERTLDLAPGEQRTLSFLYGYLPEGFNLDALIARYKAKPTEILTRSSAEWKNRGMRFDVCHRAVE